MYNQYNQQAYMKKYYRDHCKKMIKQSIQWHKDNSKKVSLISRRYREKGKRREPENRANYDKTGLKVLFIKQYGKELKKRYKDNSLKYIGRKLFCLDCADYKTDLCPQWEDCGYKEEVLEIINGKQISKSKV